MDIESVGQDKQKPCEIVRRECVCPLSDFFCKDLGKFFIAVQKLLPDRFISHHSVIKQVKSHAGGGYVAFQDVFDQAVQRGVLGRVFRP